MGKMKELFLEEQQKEQFPQVVVAKKSIYNIQAEYIELMDRIEDLGGELTPELSAQLDITKEQLESKATSYCYLSKQIDVDTAQIDAEISRLQALKSSKVKLQEQLHNRVSEAMKRFGIDNIDRNNLKLSFRSSKQLIIAEGTKIPKQFQIVKINTVVDKAKLKAHIDSGKKIKGVSILEKKNLQIK